MKKRVRKLSLAAFLLLALPGAVACGQQGGEAETSSALPSTEGDARETAGGRTEVAGWLEVLLPAGSPSIVDAASGGTRTWFLLPGDRALLCYESTTRDWRSFRIDGGNTGEFIDLAAAGDEVVLLSGDGVTVFRPDAEAVFHRFPGNFSPVSIETAGGSIAVLGEDAALALHDGGDEFRVVTPGEEVDGISGPGLFRVEPDWVFLADDGRLCRYDAEVDLWQFEQVPESGADLAERSGVLHLSVEDGSVLRREGRENWVDTGLDGTLFPRGLVLTDTGVYSVDDPSTAVACRPAISPRFLLPADAGDIVWASDELGLIAHAALGSMRTGLPDYDAEMIACTMAGQAARQTTGATGGVMPVLTTGAGVFRIYESVSSRPDPFAEFPALRFDLRRDMLDVTIEELRLVGITIDPVGGDQALVEDADGVAYILYEGTELANNTEVAEISSNEVVVVQEVTVDYGADRGGVAIIPTIYTMRLHEEGGL